MPVTPATRSRAGRLGPCFAVLAMLLFCSEAVAYAICLLVTPPPPSPVVWAAFAAVALVFAAAAALVLDRLVLAPLRQVAQDASVAQRQLETALMSKSEQHRRLRHDMRGALSPVLLVADRLVNHADPAVKRSGDIMIRTVDRATALLAEPTDGGANPLDGP